MRTWSATTALLFLSASAHAVCNPGPDGGVCLNGSVAVDTLGVCTCDCSGIVDSKGHVMYAGKYCQTQVDSRACETGANGQPCQNGVPTGLFRMLPPVVPNTATQTLYQQSTVDTSTCQCACAIGFSGSNCEVAGQCTEAKAEGWVGCLNGGTATGTTGNCTCTCPAGYTGDNCETPAGAAACASDQCNNGGVHAGTSTAGTCTCECPLGFTGTQCETPSPCSGVGSGNIPCLNSGTSSGTTGNCTCACASTAGSDSLFEANGMLYTGTHCNVQADSAACTTAGNGNMCLNGGVAGGLTGGCFCTCPQGYDGEWCEMTTACSNDNLPTAADIPGIPDGGCQNGGFPSGMLQAAFQPGAAAAAAAGTTLADADKVNGCRCKCPPEFTGEKCHVGKPCTGNAVGQACSSPDGGQGVAVGTGTNCSCKCSPGFSGADCTTRDACTAYTADELSGTLKAANVLPDSLAPWRYEGWTIEITAGPGQGQQRTLMETPDNSPNIVVDTPFNPSTTETSSYTLISPGGKLNCLHGTPKGNTGNCVCACSANWYGRACDSAEPIAFSPRSSGIGSEPIFTIEVILGSVAGFIVVVIGVIGCILHNKPSKANDATAGDDFDAEREAKTAAIDKELSMAEDRTAALVVEEGTSAVDEKKSPDSAAGTKAGALTAIPLQA